MVIVVPSSCHNTAASHVFGKGAITYMHARSMLRNFEDERFSLVGFYSLFSPD
jgi:hypothetical protein